MKVLSNDNIANIPTLRKAAQGGTATFARVFSKFLNNRKHQWVGVIFQTTNGSKAKASRVYHRGRRTNWKLYFPYKLRRQIVRATKRIPAEEVLEPAIKAAERIIKEEKPDVVFLNGFHFTFWVLLKAAKNLGVPVVVKHAGILAQDVKNYSDVFPRAARRIILEMEKDITRLADFEIFISKLGWQRYNKMVIRASTKKATLIPLPYDPFYLNKSLPPLPSGKTRNIGMVARWDRTKNHEGFLALATEAHRQKLPWKFYSVTWPPPTRKRLAFKKRFRRHIEIVPPMLPSQLKKFYQKMDLLILPSHFEMMGTVVMEALLQNRTTLISPNVGWIDTYLDLKLRKFVINFRKPKKVIPKVKKLIHRPPPPRLLKDAKKSHNPEKVFSQYLAIFRQVSSKKS